MRTPRPSLLILAVATAWPLAGRAADAQVTAATPRAPDAQVTASTARSPDVQVTSSTQYLWYGDPLAKDSAQGDIAQYLRVSAGLDDAGKVRVFGSGRLIYTPTTLGDTSDHWFGRLYYLYLDCRDCLRGLDVRAGRTYVTHGAIPGVIDGIDAVARLWSTGFGVRGFGGHRVTFDEKSEVGSWDDLLWGASLFVDTVAQTHLEAAYAQRYTGGTLGRDAVSLDLTTTPLDFLNLVGRVNYDVSASRWAEFLVQANVVPWKPLTVRAEYFQSRPSFDKFSFYNYFGVSQFQEVSGSLELALDPRYRLRAAWAYEWYDSDATANDLSAGLTLNPIPALLLNIGYEKRFGYAGGFDGLRFNGSYRIAAATIGAGIDYTDFRHDTTDPTYATRAATAKRLWASLGYDLNRTFGAVARIEDDLNFYFSHVLKGFVALNIHL